MPLSGASITSENTIDASFSRLVASLSAASSGASASVVATVVAIISFTAHLPSFLDLVSDVLDGFADRALHAADGRLRFSGHFVHDSFVVQLRIARQSAGGLLDLAFERFRLAC